MASKFGVKLFQFAAMFRIKFNKQIFFEWRFDFEGNMGTAFKKFLIICLEKLGEIDP